MDLSLMIKDELIPIRSMGFMGDHLSNLCTEKLYQEGSLNSLSIKLSF